MSAWNVCYIVLTSDKTVVFDIGLIFTEEKIVKVILHGVQSGLQLKSLLPCKMTFFMIRR